MKIKHLFAISIDAVLLACIVVGHEWGVAATLNLALFVVWAQSLLGIVALALAHKHLEGNKRESRVLTGDAVVALALAAYGHFVTASVLAISTLLLWGAMQTEEQAA